MRKILLGTLTGAVAGVIDVIPMLLQGLPASANLSAFTMWVLLGFIINTSTLEITPILKGLVLSLIVITPTAFLIGAEDISTLIPIYIITCILGSALGYISQRIE